MVDKTIRELSDKMFELINSYNLPLEVRRLVMSEVYTALKTASDNEVNRQIMTSMAESEAGEGEKDGNKL